MRTNTKLMAAAAIAASFSIAFATGAAGFFADDSDSIVVRADAPAVYQQLTAQISTDWLTPVSARRSLEQRNQALERWVAARGGWVQVIDTGSQLRTRGALGERLQAPTARFEQTLLIHVPPQHAPETIAQALEGMDVTVASIDTRRGEAAARIEF